MNYWLKTEFMQGFIKCNLINNAKLIDKRDKSEYNKSINTKHIGIVWMKLRRSQIDRKSNTTDY